MTMPDASSAPSQAPQLRPRHWEKLVLFAYLRMMGSTQKDAGRAVGRSKRTAQDWEYAAALYAEAREEARKRWLGEVGDAARAGLLRALKGDAGDLALKVLERLEPDLAPATQRFKHEGQVDLVASPTWLVLRTQILQVLAPYPEARAQLVEALTHATNGNGTGH